MNHNYNPVFRSNGSKLYLQLKAIFFPVNQEEEEEKEVEEKNEEEGEKRWRRRRFTTTM